MIEIDGTSYDTMKEACERLDIARATLLKYISEGFFSEPPTKKQGRGKSVRYFTEDWYNINEVKLRSARGS